MKEAGWKEDLMVFGRRWETARSHSPIYSNCAAWDGSMSLPCAHRPACETKAAPQILAVVRLQWIHGEGTSKPS